MRTPFAPVIQWLSGFLTLVLFCTPDLLACGGTPRPPICGKSMAFAKAPPSAPLLLTDGGTFDLPVTVYAAATAACSSVPTSVTITISLSCTPAPDGSGSLTTAISSGYNDLLVPVTVPAGPPRICTVTGTATVTFSDGMMLSNSGDTVVCIVDPAPGQPDEPRLDLELLTPEINRVHPGDQYLMRYEITNNDPNESFTGNFRIGVENAATMPIDLGVPGNGEGIFGLADPAGDHPPIYFLEDIGGGDLCVPLPRDPHLTIPNEDSKPITLMPGETQIIEVVSRHWGLCSSGTCSESIAVYEGAFSGGDEGIACSGSVLAVDPTVPPAYDWPGSGRQATAHSFEPGMAIGRFTSSFADDTPLNLDIIFQTTEVNGNEVFEGFDFADPIEPYDLRGQFFVQGPYNATDPIQGTTQIYVFGENLETNFLKLKPHVGAPAGFDNIGPIFVTTFEIDKPPFDGLPDAFVDLLVQTSTVPFAGTDFLANAPTEIFTDGFESGNVVAWSSTTAPFGGGGTVDGYQVFFDMRAFVRETSAPFPCPPDTTADFNGDGLVTVEDFHAVTSLFTNQVSTGEDRNNDGIIDVRDMVTMADKIGCQEVEVLTPSL